MVSDPGETRNLEKEHSTVVSRLTKLLERYVEDGRSTLGNKQHNDVAVDLWKKVPAKSQPADD
jgi:hypothetical protein